MAAPTEDDKEELLLSCRYGDLEDVQHFVDTFGAQHLVDTSDDNGNTILHMTCANGHSGKKFTWFYSPDTRLKLLLFFLPFLTLYSAAM